ncbi:hypothetical protein ACT3TS_04690 [Specibacter sp. AOP5-B1-6]
MKFSIRLAANSLDPIAGHPQRAALLRIQGIRIHKGVAHYDKA